MNIRRFVFFSVISALVALPLFGQAAPPNDVSQIIDSFQNATLNWLTIGEQVASSLFGILAVIEMGITLGMLALGQADITLWAATLVRKFMAIGAFYALLLLGPQLMQAIIDSYVKFGSMASGVPSITASNILGDGLEICAVLLANAVAAGASLSVFTAALLLLCAAVIGWSFIRLVKGFVMAKIESFIVVYAGVIQLGWGASRFTSTYAERYVAAAMASGVKLMVFFFILGVERSLAPGWIAAAKIAPTAFLGFLPTITLTASIVLFCAIADPEKLVAILFGGQLSFTGHDITNSYMPYVSTAIGMATSPYILSSITGRGAGAALGGAASFAGASSGAGSGAGGQTLNLVPGPNGTYSNPNPQSTPPPPPPPPPTTPRPQSTPPPYPRKP